MPIKRYTPCWICGLPILRGEIYYTYMGLEAHPECINTHKKDHPEYEEIEN